MLQKWMEHSLPTVLRRFIWKSLRREQMGPVSLPLVFHKGRVGKTLDWLATLLLQRGRLFKTTSHWVTFACCRGLSVPVAEAESWFVMSHGQRGCFGSSTHLIAHGGVRVFYKRIINDVADLRYCDTGFCLDVSFCFCCSAVLLLISKTQ